MLCEDTKVRMGAFLGVLCHTACSIACAFDNAIDVVFGRFNTGLP